MTDNDIHEFAMAQLSCLNDYHQQLTLCRQHLSQLIREKTKHEQQITVSESMLQECRQRLSSKQKKLTNLQMLKEQAHIKMSLTTTLASDVEKLKEKHSAKESYLRQLISEAEQLTVQQQKLQQELNAQVMSTGLLSADINSLTDQIAGVNLLELAGHKPVHNRWVRNQLVTFLVSEAGRRQVCDQFMTGLRPASFCGLLPLAWTDECNLEYEVQLNYKHEKMRQQLKHLEALRQKIVLLNHQLETNGSKGISAAAMSGILRHNTNYCSLPVGTRPPSLIDRISQRDNRTNAEHYQDTLSTQKVDISTNEDDANLNKVIYADSFVNASSMNNIDLQAATVGVVTSSCSQQTNINVSRHPEKLRNTSYRMIDRFADTHLSKQPLANCLPECVDHNIRLTSSSQNSAPAANSFSVITESVHMRSPFTANEPPELEQSLHSNSVVSSSSQLQLNEVGLVSCVSRPSVEVDGCDHPALLPDIIGYLSDSVTLQNTTGLGSVPSTAPASATRVPPKVAQKPKFRYPHLSGYDMTKHDCVAVFTQPNEITTMPPGCVDAVLGGPANNTSSFHNVEPHDASFTVGQDLSAEKPELQNMVDEPPLNISADFSRRETFADDDGNDFNDFTDCSRLVDRPAYKPTVVYPARRRLSIRDGSESTFTSTCLSVDTQIVKADTVSVAEDAAVCSDGSVSKVQAVKNKLQAGTSRRVQFEPLALLLDAALEGEIDLLQTTLKVCDASAANDEGITALHNAICAGHLNVAQYLVNCGCDVNAPDSDGWTPLHCAASCNNTVIAKLLVDNGACVFATALSDHQKPSEKCDPDEDDYDACLHFLQDVEIQMQKPGATVFAAFDLSAENTDELSFTVGDELTVMQCKDDVELEWWWCRLGQFTGYVPQNLIALHPRRIPSDCKELH